MIYGILKFIITIGIRLYYKEIRILNKERLPKSGPVIVVANHPNTVMDGWVLGMLFRESIHFMAKGTFFNTKFKKWLLTSLKLIPINRASESKTAGVSNMDSFAKCFELLHNKVLTKANGDKFMLQSTVSLTPIVDSNDDDSLSRDRLFVLPVIGIT